MSASTSITSACQRYDEVLGRSRHLTRLPPGYRLPQPSAAWPAENVRLLEQYRIWLDSSGASQECIRQLYIPMAGHALGLNLKPHPQLDLGPDLERALEYVKARQLGASWTTVCAMALNRFRRFLRQQRGQVEVGHRPPNLQRYQAGLPAWLVGQLTRYQHVRQGNWRPARLNQAILRFWGGQTRLWHWLFGHYPITTLADIRRQYIFDYIDHRLASGYAPKGVNQDLRAFHAFLKFLEEQDYRVPQVLLRIRALKEGDSLPRFLTDDQVSRLRSDLEGRVGEARTPASARVTPPDGCCRRPRRGSRW